MLNSVYLINQYSNKKYYYDDLKMILNNAYKDNQTSYNEKYNEESDIITIEINNKKCDNIYQVLKTLKCLKYNIEENNTQLNILIDNIVDGIIHNTKEYKEALWG